LKHYLNVDKPEYTLLEVEEDELKEYLGEYEAKLTAVTVGVDKGNLTLSQRHLGGFPTEDDEPASIEPSPPLMYGFYEKDLIVGLEETNRHNICQFVRDADGNVAWIRSGMRLHKRR
jgi:hypothetical protein